MSAQSMYEFDRSRNGAIALPWDQAEEKTRVYWTELWWAGQPKTPIPKATREAVIDALYAAYRWADDGGSSSWWSVNNCAVAVLAKLVELGWGPKVEAKVSEMEVEAGAIALAAAHDFLWGRLPENLLEAGSGIRSIPDNKQWYREDARCCLEAAAKAKKDVGL